MIQRAAVDFDTLHTCAESRTEPVGNRTPHLNGRIRCAVRLGSPPGRSATGSIRHVIGAFVCLAVPRRQGEHTPWLHADRAVREPNRSPDRAHSALVHRCQNSSMCMPRFLDFLRFLGAVVRRFWGLVRIFGFLGVVQTARLVFLELLPLFRTLDCRFSIFRRCTARLFWIFWVLCGVLGFPGSIGRLSGTVSGM